MFELAKDSGLRDFGVLKAVGLNHVKLVGRTRPWDALHIIACSVKWHDVHRLLHVICCIFDKFLEHWLDFAF